MNPKSILASKTLWINAIALAILALEKLSGSNLIDPETATLVIALLNIVNRYFTKQPVTMTLPGR